MTHLIDRPEVLRVLFHPRREYGYPAPSGDARPVAVTVAPEVKVGGRLYPAAPEAPIVLYFHGNGEIAADYDDIAALYNQIGLTLLVMDYRGYGTSDGMPTSSDLLSDAVYVFEALDPLLEEHGLAPAQIYVMGRSLGSAAAIAIAQHAGERLAGLIIESGFSDTFALLAVLGVQVRGADEDSDGFGNCSKIGQVTTRTLIIHGQNDVLIPATDGRALYHACAAHDKDLVLIPGAGHNDLMLVGIVQYFGAIRAFVSGEPVT